MVDETVEIVTNDDLSAEAEDEVLQEEVEEEEQEPEKEKKPKKAKPAKGKGRQEKGKGEEKGFSKGEAWWKENGLDLVRKGNSNRSTVLKAARAAGVPFSRAMEVLKDRGTSIEEKVLLLFG